MTIGRAEGEFSDLNEARLGRQDRLDQLIALCFALPCLALVGLCVILPCGWLLWLSVLGSDGRLGVENYARLVEEPSYLRIFATTFQVGITTVIACILIGVPFATFINGLPVRQSRFYLAAILLPFWTSLLVRAYAWLVILERNGLLNSALMSIGVIQKPLPLVFNFFGTVLGMTHIMLPVFLLPVLGSMRTIDRALIRAAASMGASRAYAFWRVFLPLATPGIAAGAVLVFVMALGFYVTPAILGGGNVIMISMRIARSLSEFGSWGAASALGVVLLLGIGAMLAVGKVLRNAVLRVRRA
jgi:ABC-type spermidine/putrescine transport system permease subunit I